MRIVPSVVSIVSVACMLSVLAGATNLAFQSSSAQFGTPVLSWHPFPGRALVGSSLPTYAFGAFTVKLYGGLSQNCGSDNILVGSRIASPPPYPGGQPAVVNASSLFFVYPANNPNQTGSIAYFCAYANDTSGHMTNSTALMLNFALIPPSTSTTSSTTSTTSSSTSTTYITSTFTTSTTSTVAPSTTTTSSTTSSSAATTYSSTSTLSTSTSSTYSTTTIQHTTIAGTVYTSSSSTIRQSTTATTTTIPQLGQVSIISVIKSAIARLLRLF